jgi:hypothetical protein
MEYFQTENATLDKFWEGLEIKVVAKFYRHLAYFELILVYFSRFGMLYQEKSGNSVKQAG